MNLSLWFQINGIIFGFDEFSNTHVRLRMHRSDSCITSRDVVRPLHKLIFLKPLIASLLDLCACEIKIWYNLC